MSILKFQLISKQMSGFLYYLTANVETEFRNYTSIKSNILLSIRKANLTLLLDLFSEMIS